MSNKLTVQDLIDQVRSQIDEDNVVSVRDRQDIIPALNRAQTYATSILARKYEEPLLEFVEISLVPNQLEYPFPDGVFEQRVEAIEIRQNTHYYPVTRMSYRDITQYENNGQSLVGLVYAIHSSNIRILPRVSTQTTARIWYLRKPETLTQQVGQISNVNTGSNYVLLNADMKLSLVSDDSTQLTSYVNIINRSTGLVRKSLQIVDIDEDNRQIQFSPSPVRTTVLGREISNDLTDIEVDDYIAPIQGSCIPTIQLETVSNFLIQHTSAELNKKLGGAGDIEQALLSKFERQVELTWSGRETTLRVKRLNSVWNPSRNRRIINPDPSNQ